VKRVLQEAALVVVIGAALAFAANALSPHGLKLSENFFAGTAKTAAAPATTNLTGTAGATTNSLAALLAARFKAEGLQLADSNQVVQLFRDPRREAGGVIFIDSRNDQEYRAGHIPGAYLFNHFHPEQYAAEVLPVCLTAEQIVFYCNGGDCDDSEHTAIMLRDSVKIPMEKVFVYGGGLHEWATNSLPIELGARNSGQLTNVARSAVSPRAEATHP
jgi:rhodanese-related sulfurtransferase